MIADVLVYFRERSSRIRPYLSGGFGLLRLSADKQPGMIDGGLRPPPAMFTTIELASRVAVGVDVPIGDGWSVRYSFSENLLRLSADKQPGMIDGGLRPPPAMFTTIELASRVAVGVDVPIGDGWSVRYSFSENLLCVFSEQRDGSCSSSRRESDAARGVPSPAAHR